MFRSELEYQLDFLANSFAVRSVLVWGLDRSKKQCSYLWKVWCLPVLYCSSLRGCWQALYLEGLLRVGDGRGGGLADVVSFCCDDNFEEDLRWEPKLGIFVDLVELDDIANGVGVTLLKTLEALRGAFFFATSVELKTKGAGGGGAGREMIDSNTHLPSTLTPKHFFLFLRSVLTDRIQPVLVFQAGCWYKAVAERFVSPRLWPGDTICSAMKLNVLLGVGG